MQIKNKNYIDKLRVKIIFPSNFMQDFNWDPTAAILDLIRKSFFSLFFLFISVANTDPLPSSVTADTVKHYLGEHPEFLDSYIQQNVNSNTIEQWRSKKTPTPTVTISSSGRKPSGSSYQPSLGPSPIPAPRASSALSSSSSMPTALLPNKNISSATAAKTTTTSTKIPLVTKSGRKDERKPTEIYHNRSLIFSRRIFRINASMIDDHKCYLFFNHF